MLDNTTLIKVRNRDNGTVGYVIPELGNLRRVFQSGETKEITMDELRKLSWIPGGKKMLKDFLVVENPEAVAELLSDVEPEYYYTEEDIKTLLQVGTLAQFQDCLEFAPEGTINLVKKLAVELRLNDVSKRDALLKATGFNVTNAIAAMDAELEDGYNKEETKTARRATPINQESQRRVAIEENPKYKILN